MVGIMFEGYTTEKEGDDTGHGETVGEKVAGVGAECD